MSVIDKSVRDTSVSFISKSLSVSVFACFQKSTLLFTHFQLDS